MVLLELPKPAYHTVRAVGVMSTILAMLALVGMSYPEVTEPLQMNLPIQVSATGSFLFCIRLGKTITKIFKNTLFLSGISHSSFCSDSFCWALLALLSHLNITTKWHR